MEIREFRDGDWAEVWPLVQEVIAEQDTYALEPSMTAGQAREFWVEKPPGLTVVAVDEGKVLGTAKMGPNRQGPGSHVSTASFIVGADARGKGVGGAMCRYALDWARERGYAGMQFNAVVESNVWAIELYQRLGFVIIGTVPGAFQHPSLGRIGLHIMYCEF